MILKNSINKLLIYDYLKSLTFPFLFWFLFIYSFIIIFLLFFVIYNLSALDIQTTNAYKIYDNLFLDERFTFLHGSAHCSIHANLFFIFSCIVKVEQSHEFSLTEPFHEFDVAKLYQIVYQTSMKTKKKYIYIWNSVKTKSMKNSGLCLCEKVHLLKNHKRCSLIRLWLLK